MPSINLNAPKLTPVPAYTPQIQLYQDWLQAERGLKFDNYDALWRWSKTELDAFWQSIWDFAAVGDALPALGVPTTSATSTHSAVLHNSGMPHVQWFPGAQVNYAAQVLRHAKAAHAAGCLAIIAENELGEVQRISWPQLQARVARVALHLKTLGVQRGDRVAAYMPNVPETMICALAAFSLGAVWSVCAPDMGAAAVLDRFTQIQPRVLIAVDGVHYGGKPQDRSATVSALLAALPSVQHALVLHTPFAAAPLHCEAKVSSLHTVFNEVLSQGAEAAVAAFAPEALPFDHPLWIVYSSGTTGMPKPLVHGHGGIVLTLLALKGLGNDIGCSYHPNSAGEIFHWYSSTGWVMWNAQMAGLATGTTVAIYDGNPSASKERPDWGVLWRFAARHGVTYFGAGAAFYASCMKAGLELANTAQCGDVSRIRCIGTTGSPLSEDVQRWGWTQFEAVRERRNLYPSGQAGWWHDAAGKIVPAPVFWCNITGGTDFCGAFIGGQIQLPQVAGEMQARLLGCAVEAWDEHGQPVVDAVGELVCTQPIPSMPLYFWGDTAHQRYLSSYFDMYPGVWRHGDWLRINAHGGCVVYGRSDATINRMGLRMGSSEIYNAVESLPEVLDSLVVDLEYLGRESYMPLFVVLQAGTALDDALKTRIHQAIGKNLSPRFCPNEIFQVAEIPRTLSGKKQELPIKKLLLGQPIEKVVNPDAMANPQSLAWYVAFAKLRSDEV